MACALWRLGVNGSVALARGTLEDGPSELVVGHQYSDRGRRSSRCSPASERSPRIVFEGGA
jgi:hypothetical protein